MTWLGVDIGGANLKLADGAGWALCAPFSLWQKPEELASKLAELFSAVPAATRLAVTMTGELCDCFRTKADGVRHILAAVNLAADDRDVHVYLVNGRWATVAQARKLPHLAAASNWHALACFACRFLQGRAGLVIDVGSTTTDVVPMAKGRPCARGSSDTERLVCGELLYQGVGRTPICAVTPQLTWRESTCPVAAEVFATTADAYVLLGDISECPDALWTADNRPLTAEFARERLARMICADAATFTMQDAQRAAESVRQAQIDRLRTALDQVLNRLDFRIECVITTGKGEFLAKRLLVEHLPDCETISLTELLDESVSICAPAHAVAVLAEEAEFE